MGRRWRNAWRNWPGITGDSLAFKSLADGVSTSRTAWATLAGSVVLIVLSRTSHSPAVGYGYGFVVFASLSWPLVPRVLSRMRWHDATMIQGVLLLLASIALGSVGDRLLGFNPQAHSLNHLSWPVASKLLWSFPLLLPVENFMLLGGLLSLWNGFKPRTVLARVGVGLLAAWLFGLWHVPFWGWPTMWVVGLSVVPWTLYLLATGDMVAPIVAHLLMDTFSIMAVASPRGSLLHHYAIPVVVVAVLAVSAGHSFWKDFQKARTISSST